MLFQHKTDEPIGVFEEIYEDQKGLFVKGKLALGTQKGREAYELLKIGALDGMSIGFRADPQKQSYNENKRGVRTLKEVDLILAEDTRRTAILLQKYSIKTRMDSFHDMNKKKKTIGVIGYLNRKNKVALVSDAGTPGISDPGFYLVRECIRNNIPVSPIPGATAFISALVCSGLPTDQLRCSQHKSCA